MLPRSLAALATLATLVAVAAQNCPGLPKFNLTGKLLVHFCPHSHDDVGWDETYFEYLNGNGPITGRNVSQILDQVTDGLAANPARRFVYVEQAFFQVWYERQSSAKQAQVQAVVASKQLSFVNSGWSMHDEANPTYIDMLDNTHVGQRNIAANFGVESLPSFSWTIDPFGHSAFQGVLMSGLSGYTGLYWAREMADLKMQSCANHTLERIWAPSRSQPGVATFQGIFVDAGYGAPGEVGRCDYPKKPSDCAASYAAGDVASLIDDILSFRANNMRLGEPEQHLALNFGDDFTWENADAYFPYLDALIAALNADGRFEAFYSSFANYTKAKLANVASFPVYTSDFFPYNDDTAGHNLWTGYFTSRPSFKGHVRESSSVLQSARQMQALVGGVTDLGPSNPLFALERAMGVAQHHDAISGTAQQRVNDDYLRILAAGRDDAFASLAASFATLTGYAGAPFAACPLANASLCPALESGAPAIALIYNARSSASAAAPVRLSVGFPAGVASYAVFDAAGAPLIAQLVPLSARDAELRALYGGSATPVQWLYLQTPVPAAGFAAIFLVPSATAVPTTHASVLAHAATAAGDVNVSNGRLTLTVAAATGWMSALSDASSGVALPLAQSWLSYVGFNGKTALNGSKQASGAYIFRPATQAAAPVEAGAASVALVTGPVVNLTQHALGYVTQETRLWAGDARVELEWTVGPVDVSDGQSHEVIARYESGLASAGAWTTDSNCREAQPRVRNARQNYTTVLSEPTSGNYYPVNCLIKTAGADGTTLAIAVDRSQGGASLADGALELMVHRRMLFDDGRGVGEALNEPGVDGKGLIIRGRHLLVAAPAAAAPAAYQALQQHAVSQPHAVAMFAGLAGASVPAWLAAHTANASALAAPLPPNVHLATLVAQSPNTLLLRLAHTFELGEDPALSQPVTLSLAGLLARKTITAATEMTLPGTQPLAGVPVQVYKTDGGATYAVPELPTPPAGADLAVTLTVQQIRTFSCTFVTAAEA